MTAPVLIVLPSLNRGGAERHAVLLATAVALSFGAPFWFELLGKLINLRSSGKPPSGSADGGGSPAPPIPIGPDRSGAESSKPVPAAR